MRRMITILLFLIIFVVTICIIIIFFSIHFSLLIWIYCITISIIFTKQTTETIIQWLGFFTKRCWLRLLIKPSDLFFIFEFVKKQFLRHINILIFDHIKVLILCRFLDFTTTLSNIMNINYFFFTKKLFLWRWFHSSSIILSLFGFDFIHFIKRILQLLRITKSFIW